ncbi:MAG: hypothetical protein QXX51_08465 [Candidatus Bathyarchaeia archaeon]
MKKLSIVLLLVAMLMISTILIAVPLTRCEEEDPVRPLYNGEPYTDSPGYNFGEFPCNTQWLNFEVDVVWFNPPRYNPPSNPLVTIPVTMASSIDGTIFTPSSFTLNNYNHTSEPVSVSVPIGGLVPGTYYAWIGEQEHGAPGYNPMYFYFTKVPCVVTATVTFDVVGVGSDFTGTVLTVDGNGYGVGDLPQSFTWDIGSEHTFAYGSPLSVSDCKRYVWDSTSGLSTDQSGTITVPSGGGTVTAYYHTEYYLTVKTDPEGLVEIPGTGWYKEGTDVELTAPEVAGYIFVYWDVDGTAVEGNPITVTMDTCHTATAHYWPELEYKQFVTDSSFNVIERFDTVWTPKDAKKIILKLASTNPGQFYLNIEITNTWPVNTGPITITFTLDDDFVIHPVQGNPVQVWTGYGLTGTQVPAAITYGNKSGTVTIGGLEPGQTVYVTVHMEYAWKGQYFTKDDMVAWKDTHGYEDIFDCGYAATVPGPFPFDITGATSTKISDPVVVLGLED